MFHRNDFEKLEALKRICIKIESVFSMVLIKEDFKKYLKFFISF